MPRPKKPWIAVDFEAKSTYVSVVPDDSNEPVELVFSNLFLYENVIRPIEPDDLTLENAKNVFTLDFINIKRGAKVYVNDETTFLTIDSILTAFFAHIKSTCEKKYFKGKQISVCYFVERPRKHFLEPLKSAALNAGFEEVAFRARSWALISEEAYASPFDRYAVVCDLSYGYTSLTLFKAVGDGYGQSELPNSEMRLYYGCDDVVEATARKMISSYDKQKKPEESLGNFKTAISMKIVNMLRRPLTSDSDYRIKWFGQRLLTTSDATMDRVQRYLACVERLFKNYFSELSVALPKKNYDVLVVGPGAISGLSSLIEESLRKYARSATKIVVLGDKSAATAWCSLLIKISTRPKNPSREESAYYREYESAVQGKSKGEALYKLAKRYFYGKDAVYSPEEGTYWLEKASELKYVDAQLALASLYTSGRVVPRDSDKALEWYKNAAHAGSAKAQYKLGVYYGQANKTELEVHYIGLAINQNYPKAISFVKRNKNVREALGAQLQELEKRTAQKGQAGPSTLLETVIGLGTAALVFILGGSLFQVCFTHGELQKRWAEYAFTASYICALALVVVIAVLSPRFFLQKQTPSEENS